MLIREHDPGYITWDTFLTNPGCREVQFDATVSIPAIPANQRIEVG